MTFIRHRIPALLALLLAGASLTACCGGPFHHDRCGGPPDYHGGYHGGPGDHGPGPGPGDGRGGPGRP